MKSKLIISLLFVALLGPAAIADARDVSLKKKTFTFLPQWEPQAQFAGYYVALKKELYKKHQIDLNILKGGPGRPSADLLRDKEVDFATIWLSTAIQMRSKGIKLLNIAQMMQRSALMLVAKKSSGITHPRHMDKKKIGLWGADFQVQPKAFFRKYNVEPITIRQANTVNLFLRGGVDVASAMYYNEYHTILNAGINEDELTPFFFHEHGLNFPEDGIYTLEETFEEYPEICKAFVRASIEGWKEAFRDPVEAIKTVLEYRKKAGLPVQEVHQNWMLARMRDLTVPTRYTTVGKLHHNDFKKVADVLKNLGVIDTPPRYGEFYRRSYAHD